MVCNTKNKTICSDNCINCTMYDECNERPVSGAIIAFPLFVVVVFVMLILGVLL